MMSLVLVKWSKVVQSPRAFESIVDKFPHGLEVRWRRKAGVENDSTGFSLSNPVHGGGRGKRVQGSYGGL